MPTVPAWTASGSALPGCPCVHGAEADRRPGLRWRCEPRSKEDELTLTVCGTAPSPPCREETFPRRPGVSFLPLGVRLGGGPNRPPRPPGRPPAGWDRSARPPQAPRAPLETEGLGKAMNSAELRHYTHANTRARTQLRCGLGVPPPSRTQSDSRASETVLPLMGEACVKRLTNKACHDQTEKPTKTVCRKSNPSVSGLALRSIPKLASSSPDGGGGGGTQREQNKPLPCKWCNSIHLRVAPREPGSLAALQLPPRPAPPRAPRAPRPRPWWPPRPCSPRPRAQALPP